MKMKQNFLSGFENEVFITKTLQPEQKGGYANMNKEQLEQMKHGIGFIAALDQSGGSTPKALHDYGIESSEYHTEAEMYDLIQQMRSRVITSKSFTSEHILGGDPFRKNNGS